MRKLFVAASAALIAATLGLGSATLANPGGGGGGSGGSSAEESAVPSMSDVNKLIKAERWRDAIDLLKLIVADNPRSADAYNLLGYAYRNLGDFKRAGQFYGRALKIDPNHTGALEYQGILFVKTGDLVSARANLERIKGLCGTGCENYQDLAEAIGG